MAGLYNHPGVLYPAANAGGLDMNPYKFADLPPISDCPFCWSGNVGLNRTPDSVWVNCEECGADGPACGDSEDAITKWGTPTHDIDMLKADCERLRRELDDCNGVIR